MKVTYVLTAKPPVPCSSVPGSLHVDDVDVEWDIAGTALNGMNLIMHNQQVHTNPSTGALVVRDLVRDVIAFRVASFLADTVYALTGIGAFNPHEVFTRSPELDGETPREKALVSHAMKESSLSIGASAALSRNLNGSRLASSVPQALAIAHYTRAMRATDPFERFEELYKVVETTVPPAIERDRDKSKLDQWVSAQASGIDPLFTPTRAEDLRLLRNRITHPQAKLGHLNPHDLQHIDEARVNLDDLERLARILIWGTAEPWL